MPMKSGAVFDERDKHLPVAFGALLIGDVARDLRRADYVSCSSLIGEMVSETVMRWPSLRTRSVS
jgi:hypothetical protein